MKLKRNLNFLFIIILIFAVVITSCIILFKSNTALSISQSAISNATSLGGGEDIFTNGKLNSKAVLDSVKTLFGNDNPIDYIKGNHDTTEFGLTKTYVVSSPTINKKADDSNYGFIIKLGGMDCSYGVGE